MHLCIIKNLMRRVNDRNGRRAAMHIEFYRRSALIFLRSHLTCTLLIYFLICRSHAHVFLLCDGSLLRRNL